jgi:hypothetical protein
VTVADEGAFRGNDDVGRERELEAAGDGMTVDRRDDGQTAPLELREG